MKKKKCVSALLSLLIVFTLILPVYAYDITPYYVGDGNVQGRIWRGSNSYAVVADAVNDATKIDVFGTLYEDGWLWDTKVSSCSNSAAGTACTASGSYTFDSSKKYRLEYSATFYYSNGTSETVTGSTTG